ncbi:MAG: hypothetical protein WD751_09470 [Anaerolineales bacterium]
MQDHLAKQETRGLYYLFALFSFAVVAAVFWEFAEYLKDLLFGSNSQVGLRNTMKDLFFGALGNGVFVVLLALRRENG